MLGIASRNIGAKRKRMYADGLSVLAICVSITAASGASAQEADGTALEEIVVTAQKRTERLQDTPIAITALSSTALSDRSVQSLVDVAATVPTMVASAGPGGGSAGNYFLRGVGQSDYVVTFDPGVGTYVDEVYLGRSQGAALELVDIERVEVLRGPQGTLFGRNTIGGAVSVVSAPPGDSMEGKMTVGVGRFNRLYGSVTVDVPLAGDVVLSKFSFRASRENGYMKSLAPADSFNPIGLAKGRFGDERTVAARGTILFKPSDTFSLTVIGDWTQSDGSADPHNAYAVNPAFGFNPIYVTDSFRETYNGFRGADDLNVWGISATAQWDLGDVSLKSITAYRDMLNLTGIDFDGSPLLLLDNWVRTDQNQFSQELQLLGSFWDKRFEWVLGAYYFKEKIRQDLVFRVYGTPLIEDVDPDVTSYAMFLHSTLNATEKLSFTLGGRYTHEKKKTFLNFRYDLGGGVILPAFPAQSVGDSWNSFTPKLGINYKANRDLLLYASYSQGFRSGGVNGRPFTAGELTTFDPETVKSYEVGFKTEFPEIGLRLNGAAFYNDYTDIQLPSFELTPEGASVIRTDNAGKAEIYGFELEWLFRATDHFTLDGGVGYLGNGYKKLNPNPDIDIDDKLPHAPKWSITVGAQYEIPIDENSLKLRADWSYKSRYAFWPANNPGDFENGYDLLNLRVSYVDVDGWSLSAFGKNVLNEKYYAFREDVYSSFGVSLNWPAPPAKWGLEFSTRF